MKLKNLETRRSVRSFTKDALTQEQVNNILTSALVTPTTMGSQPFKLVVVRRNEIASDKLQAMTWGQTHVTEADMIVYVYAIKRNGVDANWMESKLYYVPEDMRKERVAGTINHFANTFDLPGAAHAVAYGMALEADANGVASVIFSGFDREAVTNQFKDITPANYEPVVAVSFGIKSDKAVVYPKQLAPLSDFVINFKK